MSGDFSRCPKPIKGYLLSVDASATTPFHGSLLLFQYNPDKLVRTISLLDPHVAVVAGEPQTSNLQTTPTEYIYLTLEMDATDQLEQPQKNVAAAQNGLHPQLAALELMINPDASGDVQAQPKMVLFYWGPRRMVPVRLLNLKVTEEAFDVNLNPIRVSVDVCMRVVSLSELKKGSLCYSVYQNHLTLKQSLADLYKQTLTSNNTTASTSSAQSSSVSNQSPSTASANPTNSKANPSTHKVLNIKTKSNP